MRQKLETLGIPVVATRAGVEATLAWPKIAEATVEVYRDVIAKQRKR